MSQSAKHSKANNLLTGPINKTLRDMTVPMILGMIMLLTFNLVDTFFVSLLGTVQLASISFTFPVTFTLISLNIGLGIGASATIAKYLGSGQTHLAKEFGTGALTLSVGMVGALAVLGWFTVDPIFRLLGASEQELVHIRDYMLIWYGAGVLLAIPMVGNSVLRASGDTKSPSVIMALGGLINAIMDPVLIFGFGPIPALGIKGAAIATLIAWAVCSVLILYLLACKRKLILPRLLTLEELRFTSKPILHIGLPAAGANMMTPIAGAILTRLVATFGTEAVAAWGVGNRIESIASIVVLALSMTLPPFVSQNFGANKIHRVDEAYTRVMRFILVWQLGVFALMAILAPWIAMAFTSDPRVAELIKLFLLIVPLGYGLQGVIILTNSSLNALHKPMLAVVLSIVRLFVFFVPASLLGSYLYQLQGMFWGGVIANACTAAVAYFWFKRLVRESSAADAAMAQQEVN